MRRSTSRGTPFPEIFSGEGVQGGPDGARAYRATGNAKVKNIVLDWGPDHVGAPRTHQLARNATSRA